MGACAQNAASPQGPSAVGKYSIQSISSVAIGIVEQAWMEVRKVPYISENRDKRHLAEIMVLEERGHHSGTNDDEENIVGTAMGVRSSPPPLPHPIPTCKPSNAS
jgi:hypothetical protein